jgi:hypothetical protein
MKHRNTFNIRDKIITKWSNSEFLFKYMYPNDTLTKFTLYKEYCDYSDNVNKHKTKMQYLKYLSLKIKEESKKTNPNDIYNKISNRLENIYNV